MLKLVIDKDYVIVEGVRIERPTKLAPSQWLGMWERLLPVSNP